MNSSIYRLSFDFIQQQGHYLVFSEKEELPLKADDLVPLQMKMIESNAIPRLLPIQVEEIDFQTRLLYEMSSARMLSLYLRENTISMNDYYDLFFAIIDALEDSPLYMLDKQKYILTEDFIFVGEDVHDIRLTYLPVRNLPEKPPIMDALKDLLLDVAGEVEELEGRAFKAILAYVRNPNATLAGLKKKLREFQAGSPTEPESSDEKTSSDLQNTSLSEKQTSWVQEVVETSSDSVREEDSPGEESFLSVEKPEKREKIYMIAVILIILALVWKLYGSFPSPRILFVSSILSFLSIVALVVFWKFWRPWDSVRSVENPNSDVDEKALSPEMAVETEKSKRESVTQSRHFHSDITDNPASISQDKESYYSNLENKTTLLTETENTVLLNEEMDGASCYPYLQVERDGNAEKISIHEQSFVIGRSPSNVQYVESSAGVSRFHLEIVKQDGAIAAKDLGSKNGSLLNGRRMIPYKTYPLKEEDQLIIGTTLFTFFAGPFGIKVQ